MHLNTLLSLALASVVAADDTVYGAFIFHRHTDRTWKATPPTRLSTLGQVDAFSSGSYWRSRFLNPNSTHHISGISEDVYSSTQVKPYAPDEPVLVTTANSFMQGFYPPTTSATEKLANGTALEAPLSGFQYANVHTITATSPDAIWLKGDDSCPAAEAASKKVSTSSLATEAQTFYESFYETIFRGVWDKSKLTFDNAFLIFDYINIGVSHNSTIAKLVSASQLQQLQYLASEAEFGTSGDVAASSTNMLATGGRTLAGRIVSEFTTMIKGGAKQKLSANFGSYDTMLAFFGLTGLPSVSAQFKSLPLLGSVLSFELVAEYDSETLPQEKDLFIKFYFRNGTAASTEAQQFPLFPALNGAAHRIPWLTFKEQMETIAIKNVEEWCVSCQSEQAFCAQYEGSAFAAEQKLNAASSDKKLSLAAAGGIGAGVTIAVFGILAAIALLAGVRIGKKQKPVVIPAGKEYHSDADSV